MPIRNTRSATRAHRQDLGGLTGDRDFLWVNNARVLCYPRREEKRAERLLDGWGKPRLQGLDPLWEADCPESLAIALGKNAVVVAKGSVLVAYNLQDGQPFWEQTLPGVPVPWGLAVDRAGRVIVTLENGQAVCYGPTTLSAAR